MTRMKTIVINLPSRADRRREMEAQLANVGIEAEFFAAIRPADSGRFPSVGHRGCCLSHLEVLKRARRDQVTRLLLLEDDLNFSRAFKQEWPRALREIELRDWSIFYPAHRFGGGGLVQLSPTTPLLGTHMMLFNATIIDHLIAGLETIFSRPEGHPLGGPMPIDGAYTTLRAQNPNISTFAYSPALGYQRSSRSDIAEDKIVDKFTVLRPAIGLARKLINFSGIKRPE
jgi:glycosyl transferase family 25